MLQLLFYFNEITIFSLRCQSLLQIKWSYFPAMADHLPVINVAATTFYLSQCKNIVLHAIHTVKMCSLVSLK
jgi:hypothetical protein